MATIKNSLSVKRYRSLLELKYSEARKFFLKSRRYCTLELPEYFCFDELLKKISNELENKQIGEYMKDSCNPRNYDDVNHVILNNKDGQYAWRSIQLIHPALYVSLVHTITNKDNWGFIQSKFRKFSEDSKIMCMSIPPEPLDKNSDKEKQISHWWHEVEQKSIELALDYEYLIQTDITHCYSSIYTHSIVWALHDKITAKQERRNKKLLGNIIDNHIQEMTYGQTNGIPEGSVLMDFIAELVLGYADLLLAKKIKNIDYHIIRYRDDYRIFTNNQDDAKQIVKCLSEVLRELGLKLNPNKTQGSAHIIENSIKKDKLYWMCQKQEDKNLQHHLLIIHTLATEHPNSGSLLKALDKYFKRLRNNKITKNQAKVFISIIVDIALKNPKTYPISVAMLSYFVQLLDNKKEVTDKIKRRFDKLPNTEFIEVWLQRLTLPLQLDMSFNSQLCNLAAQLPAKIWNNDWLGENSKLKDIIEKTKIINLDKIKKLSKIIEPREVSLFIDSSY
jgi:RNA-directed DNA polymerase